MTAFKDYLFVLNPPQKVEESIKLYKNGATEFIGNYPGMHSKAHISLWQKQRVSPYIIEAFVNSIQHKISSIPPTNVTIDGFSYFVHGNDLMTIYASIQSTYLTDNWFALIRKQLNLNGDGFVPHITVTKTIHIDSFYTLWKQFSTTSFQMSFVPASITVLERDTHDEHSTWQPYQELYFKNVNQF